MVTRRTMLQRTGLAGLAIAASELRALGLPADWLQAQEDVVPFTDVPDNFVTVNAATKRVAGLDLRQLTSYITPAQNHFVVAHYGVPQIDAAAWRLDVRGRVANARSYTLDELRKRARVQRECTFECGGNRGATIMNRMIGNARWTGTALWPIIQDARPLDDGLEVIFWGADEGEEEIRKEKYRQAFARSMTLNDLARSDAILAWEMNGEPLPADHGFPVRVVVPGWYGVQNVKWLSSLEVSPDRFMGRFQARDYVTIMGRQHAGKTEWVETSVTRIRTKSMIARVTRQPNGALTVFGVAITDGTPLKSVDVQLDEGPWVPARMDKPANPFAWTWFRAELPAPAAGPHTVASKATDTAGRTQPPNLDLKKTNWENNAIWRRQIQIA